MANAELQPSCVFAIVKRANDLNMERDMRKHILAHAEPCHFWKNHAVQFYFSLRICHCNGI